MPLKLIPPREGRTQNWSVRGTYLGQYLDRSAGTPRKDVAAKLLVKWKGEIERGELASRQDLTFAGAALSYLQAGGEDRFLKPIIEHFGPKRAAIEIDQAAIDDCAVALYPDRTPATRNRQVYSPVSAILRHAGIALQLKRPKGAQGRQLIHWHRPEDYAALVAAAEAIDLEFSIYLVYLAHTGLRLSESLTLDCEDVDLNAQIALIGRTKNEEPRAIYLPPPLIVALANHPRGLNHKGRVFRFRKNGRLYSLMRQAAAAAGVKRGFHILRHTYATWMRRYGKLSVEDLADAGGWKDVKSAKRYAHADIDELARRADAFPTVKVKKRGISGDRVKAGVSKR